MRGTYPFSKAFPISAVPLIPQPFGLPPSPKGKALELWLPLGEAVERSRLMRGTYPFSKAFPISAVPLIHQPFGLPPSPRRA